MLMKKKRIYVNTKRTRYITVKLYNNKKEMREAYKVFRPKDWGHNNVLGVHCGYVKYETTGKKTVMSNETGTVFLSLKNCGAGVVTHELMHAVLWAWKHNEKKEQYPIVIKSMRYEEEILHNHTYAVTQFYNWYFKIKRRLT